MLFFYTILIWIAQIFGFENPGTFLQFDNTAPFSLPILKSPSTFKGCDNETKFIVGIISHPSEFNFRYFIRNTWGAPVYRNLLIDTQIEQESARFSDTLIFDYQENYSLVARKIFGYFRYVSENCPNVKCVLKGDSDTVINLVGMEKLCALMPDKNHTITGYYGYDKPIRELGSKWYTPYFIWPFKTWPSLASGFSYLLSGYGIVPRLLKTLKTKTAFFTSENFRRLWEDILFTGVVRDLAGIPLVHNTGFHWGNKVEYWNYEGKRIILSLETRTQCTKNCTLEYAWEQVQRNRKENNFAQYLIMGCYLRSLKEVPAFKSMAKPTRPRINETTRR